MDGAVAEGTVSYFDQRRQETVEIAVGRASAAGEAGHALRGRHPDRAHRPVDLVAGTGSADPERFDELRSAGAADPRAGSERPAQVLHGGAGDLRLTHYPEKSPEHEAAVMAYDVAENMIIERRRRYGYEHPVLKSSSSVTKTLCLATLDRLAAPHC